MDGFCPYCHLPLAPRRKNHCGAEDCRKAYNRTRMRAYNEAYKAKHGNWPTRRYKEDPAKKRVRNQANRVLRSCVTCGDEWLTPRRDGKYCSFLCRSIGNGAATICDVPEDHPSRVGAYCKVPASHPARQWRERKPRVFVSGRCMRCDDLFLIADQTSARYCSMRCARADSKDRRRAREREAYVEPVFRQRVFERDGWRCRLCGLDVDREATAPSPLAPSLDHVVALAKGGDHSMANVQTAHFLCNARKGDREWNAGSTAAA